MYPRPTRKSIFANRPAPPEVPGYYSTEEVASIFGWTSRQMVFTLAKKEGWGTSSEKAPRKGMTLYCEQDVIRYWEARRRTELLFRLGVGPRGILRVPRDGEQDTICPVCGEYAYSTTTGMLCVNNHRRLTSAKKRKK